jgi:CheY-like chemotaxis protein
LWNKGVTHCGCFWRAWSLFSQRRWRRHWAARGYRVDDEYSVDRVLRTLRRQPYDVVIIAGLLRYLNSTELVRALRRDAGSDGFPAIPVVLPSVNRADRYRFDTAGADCVVALEGESLLGALVAGIDVSLAARKVESERT